MTEPDEAELEPAVPALLLEWAALEEDVTADMTRRESVEACRSSVLVWSEEQEGQEGVVGASREDASFNMLGQMKVGTHERLHTLRASQRERLVIECSCKSECFGLRPVVLQGCSRKERGRCEREPYSCSNSPSCQKSNQGRRKSVIQGTLGKDRQE